MLFFMVNRTMWMRRFQVQLTSSGQDLAQGFVTCMGKQNCCEIYCWHEHATGFHMPLSRPFRAGPAQRALIAKNCHHRVDWQPYVHTFFWLPSKHHLLDDLLTFWQADPKSNVSALKERICEEDKERRAPCLPFRFSYSSCINTRLGDLGDM